MVWIHEGSISLNAKKTKYTNHKKEIKAISSRWITWRDNLFSLSMTATHQVGNLESNQSHLLTRKTRHQIIWAKNLPLRIILRSSIDNHKTSNKLKSSQLNKKKRSKTVFTFIRSCNSKCRLWLLQSVICNFQIIWPNFLLLMFYLHFPITI